MLRSLSDLASRISRMKQGVRFVQIPPDGSPWIWPGDSSDGGAEESKGVCASGDADDSSKVVRVLGVPGCPLRPPQRPWDDSIFPPSSIVFDHALHEARQRLENATEDSEEQLSKLKFRLVALRAYAPGITVEDIMNDPRLDLESLPMVSKHDVSECIKSYVAVLRTVEASDSYFKCLLFLVSGDYNQLSTSPTGLLNILRIQNVYLEVTGFDLASTLKAYLALCDLHNPSRSEDSKMTLLKKLEGDNYYQMSSIFKVGLDRALFSTSSKT